MSKQAKQRQIEIPRLLFSAPKSGSGKTLITCGFLELLKRRGLAPCALKCGPDYIDPMFHKYVLGIPGANLDSFFLDREEVAGVLTRLYEKQGSKIAVVEGVMGYYDGLGGSSERASAYEIACLTKTPVVLIVDARGASLSLAALIKGFVRFREDSRIAGVIFNRISGSVYERLAPVIEKETGVKGLGFLPEIPQFHLESRHLGLFLPEEIETLKGTISALADQIERSVDVDRLLCLAREAEPLAGERKMPVLGNISLTEAGKGSPVRIGVARDEAFCFYYQENLDIMEEMGAVPVLFDPIRDKKLPKGIAGLWLGGGYPENYAKELSENKMMCHAVRQAAEDGMPILAECGGFLYLHRALEGSDGRHYPMAGVVDVEAYRTAKLNRFGYITLTSPRGMKIKGHEFHYWESEKPGEDWLAEKPVGGRSWRCMYEENGQVAGFPHLYYPSNPEFPAWWLEQCRNYEQKKKEKNGEKDDLILKDSRMGDRDER